MDQIGYVIDTQGDFAVVDVRRTSACGDKCSSCGGGCNVPATRVNIENTMGAKVGSFVEIEIETKSLMKSAFIVYVIPLIMLIVGIAGGIHIFQNMGFSNYEILGFLTGILALGLSFIVLKVIDNYVKEKNNSELKIVKIL